MSAVDDRIHIKGDVTAVEQVSVNDKGGSISAILRKGLRKFSARPGQRMTAAALEFTPGHGLLLFSGNEERQFHVTRIGQGRYEIAVDEDGQEEVDDVTAAFLSIKGQQFKSGSLRLTEPVSADAFGKEMDEAFAASAPDDEADSGHGRDEA